MRLHTVPESMDLVSSRDFIAQRDLPSGLWRRLALIALPCLALIGLQGYQALRLDPELTNNRELVVHAFDVITTAEALDRAVQEAVRGQHGYLITGDDAHLVTYGNGTHKVPFLLATLARLTANNPQQRRRLSELERGIAVELAQLQRGLEARERIGFSAALEAEQTNVGRDAMSAIGSLIESMITSENALLTQRLARAADATRSSTYNALVGGAIGFAIMMLGIALTLAVFRSEHRMGAERRASEQRFRLLVDGAADHALFMLDPQGRISHWNAGAQRLKGYSADEVVGQHFSRFFTEEDRKAQVPEHALQVAAREGKFHAEGWRVRKDGSRFYSSTVVTALRDAAGQLIGFAKIARDVTERAQQQEALEQARAALAQSQKMEALGQLTGGMAHDFNNILHVIKNAIEIVQARVPALDPSAVKYLEMAARNADRAAGVTRRLLAFARRQPLDPKPLSPNNLIQSMSDLLRHAVGEGIELETVLGAGVWPIAADTNQLETAILNLAVNSRDAMQRSGKLTTETANAFLDESYVATHPYVKPGQYVMIAVSDTGVGMTKEVVARAFEPFFTTKAPGHGTGLGLSQVFGFVKQSGGHVTIYSEPGEGTTVKLYLPRHRTQDAALLVEPQAALEGASGETVLVVEDDDDVRAFVGEMLEELGYRVVIAPDAASALKVFETQPDIDLLFTDIGLPNGVNGRQLADEVLRRRPQTRVLFTTAYAHNAIVHHGRLDPGVNLIVKPFTRSELANKVRLALERVAESAAR